MSPLTGTTLLIRLAWPDGTLGEERKKEGDRERMKERTGQEVRLKEEKEMERERIERERFIEKHL